MAAECKAPRHIDRSNIESVDPEIAWNRIKQAISVRDMDDAKLAIQQYVKATPDITYLELEKAFRNQSLGLFLIAVEKPDLLFNLTLMDLQGHCDKKYTVSYRFSDKPARPRERAFFPKDPQENLERLKDAGEPTSSGKRKCYNCDQIGHSSAACPEEKIEREQILIKCLNCDGVGHRIRDCKFITSGFVEVQRLTCSSRPRGTCRQETERRSVHS
ncbi:cellular nucleic acid-binding protein [Microdochium nivale]|nr:cellular nucleic acid-binding protein [Microdochium nivale]